MAQITIWSRIPHRLPESALEWVSSRSPICVLYMGVLLFGLLLFRKWQLAAESCRSKQTRWNRKRDYWRKFRDIESDCNAQREIQQHECIVSLVAIILLTTESGMPERNTNFVESCTPAGMVRVSSGS